MREDGKPVDDFLIIPGVEVTTAEIHFIIGRCIIMKINLRDTGVGLSRIIHDRGGLAIPRICLIICFRAGIRFNTLEKSLDAIEVFNAATTLRRYNRYAFKYAQLRGLPMTAASDAHHSEAVGTAYTILNTDDFSVKGVLDQIVKGTGKTIQHYMTPKDEACCKTRNNWILRLCYCMKRVTDSL